MKIQIQIILSHFNSQSSIRLCNFHRLYLLILLFIASFMIIHGLRLLSHTYLSTFSYFHVNYSYIFQTHLHKLKVSKLEFLRSKMFFITFIFLWISHMYLYVVYGSFIITDTCFHVTFLVWITSHYCFPFFRKFIIVEMISVFYVFDT